LQKKGKQFVNQKTLFSQKTFKNPGLMNFLKNENHSTLLHEKFKPFNTVQVDSLEIPTLNFHKTLLGYYNKKIGLLNLD
jgi:hypothetical protein